MTVLGQNKILLQSTRSVPKTRSRNTSSVERTLGECLAVTFHSNPVDLSLSLGDVATLATILLRPSSFLQQRTTTYKSQDPQTGQEHRILGKGTHTHVHTRCKAQPQSQRCVQLHSQPDGTILMSFQTSANLLTLHWRYLIYDHSTSPRWNPSSLVNVLDPPRAAALVPTDGTLVPQLPPYQPVFATNPVQLQKLPQLLPSHEEFLTSETETASLGLWNSVCSNVITKSVLVTEICGGDPLSILYRIPLPQDQKLTPSLSGPGCPSPP